MAACGEVPGLAERVRCGHREECYYGASDLSKFFRKPYGAGWALVGDAGCHKDPYLALGICDAFRDVELLVDAVDTGLSGRGDLLGALQEYEKRRNEASKPDYWQNLNTSRFIPPPDEVFRIRAAVRGNQEMTTRFFSRARRHDPARVILQPGEHGAAARDDVLTHSSQSTLRNPGHASLRALRSTLESRTLRTR
jgi:hypothetical protein